MRVHQILSGAGPRDAISAEALLIRSHFQRWGWAGGDYGIRIVPGLNGAVLPLGRLRPDPGDVLLIHHSASAPGLEGLLALPNPKLLVYHNVTPPEWLWEHAPVVAVYCVLGRRQLPGLLAQVDLAVARSRFTADELRELGAPRVEVIPLLLDLERLGPGPRDSGGQGAASSDEPTILFVGRIAPHKRQDEVIRAFALYRRYRCPAARLILVGDPITRRYGELVSELAQRLAPDAVTIESGLSDRTLGERYRQADVFLCLSEHEGFCIPLLEAFHFGLPVIARAQPAVAETVGGAAVLVRERDLGLVAELLHLAVSDEGLRRQLRHRGAERLREFSPLLVAERLREVVEETARLGAARRGLVGPAAALDPAGVA